MHVTLERLLHVHRGSYREFEQAPAARFATRVELYRRLHRAKDYLECSLDTPIGLEDSALLACLSPHHFLRMFKKVFGVTPHQYLSRKRMERAKHLALLTDMP